MESRANLKEMHRTPRINGTSHLAGTLPAAARRHISEANERSNRRTCAAVVRCQNGCNGCAQAVAVHQLASVVPPRLNLLRTKKAPFIQGCNVCIAEANTRRNRSTERFQAWRQNLVPQWICEGPRRASSGRRGRSLHRSLPLSTPNYRVPVEQRPVHGRALCKRRTAEAQVNSEQKCQARNNTNGTARTRPLDQPVMTSRVPSLSTSKAPTAHTLWRLLTRHRRERDSYTPAHHGGRPSRWFVNEVIVAMTTELNMIGPQWRCYKWVGQWGANDTNGLGYD